MKKTVNSVLAVLVLAVLAVFLTTEGAEAFCVYNKTDKKMRVEQTGGHGARFYSKFVAELLPGESACCNWQNEDCNKEGKKDSIVRFEVFYHTEGFFPGREHVCRDYPIQAAGALTVEGSSGNYRCVRHDYGPPPPLPIGPLQ